MRLESSTPRTWIVAAITVVSALCWVAALLGLGGGVAPLGRGDVAPPPLPSLPPLQAAPMAGTGSYDAVSTRSLFSEDRRPHPFRLRADDAASASRVRLTGVLLAGDFAMATLTDEQDRSLRLHVNGEAVEGWQLLALEPRRATLLGPEGAVVLELAVFDGKGGQPPTVLGTQDAQRALPPLPGAGQTQRRDAATGAGRAEQAVPGPAAAPAPAVTNGPSEEQMNAIRERIRARRAQLQQQQQQQKQQSGSPAGGAANR